MSGFFNTEVVRGYIPTNPKSLLGCLGFSTSFTTLPWASSSDTPNLCGSWTLVRATRASQPLSWNSAAIDITAASGKCTIALLDKIPETHVPEITEHVYGQYHVSKQNRDEPKSQLEKDGIRAGIYYPRLITENPPLRLFVGALMPQAEKATKEVLSLPVHPALSEDDLGRIVHSVKGFYG